MTVDVNDTQLGALLLQARVITLYALDCALQAQRAQSPAPPLGSILIEQNACTLAQIHDVLTIQQGLRSNAQLDQALATADLAAFGHAQHTPSVSEQTTRLKRISDAFLPQSRACKDD